MPQVQFLLDHDGSVLVDRIGRLEDFNEDCAQIFAVLGLNLDHLPGHVNRSKRQSFRHYYSDREAVDMVADILNAERDPSITDQAKQSLLNLFFG